MTDSLLKRDLQASIMWEQAMAAHKELANDPGVAAHREAMKRIRPDLSNTSDTDVCGWLQQMETEAREFHDEYAEAKSHRAYDQLAPDLVYHLKCAIITIQDMRERHGRG